MSEFEFFDELPPKLPPPRGARAHRAELIEAFTDALRQRPGVWGKWPAPIELQTVCTYRKRIKDASMPAFRGGGFDAFARNNTLYVRYVGEGVSDGDQ